MVEPVTFVPVARAVSATDPSLSKARAAQAAPPTPTADIVPANESPTYVTTLRNVAAQGAPVDAERVASIRERIEQRTYPLDSARIADAMLNFIGTGR